MFFSIVIMEMQKHRQKLFEEQLWLHEIVQLLYN